jgi:hypothetical protein
MNVTLELPPRRRGRGARLHTVPTDSYSLFSNPTSMQWTAACVVAVLLCGVVVVDVMGESTVVDMSKYLGEEDLSRATVTWELLSGFYPRGTLPTETLKMVPYSEHTNVPFGVPSPGYEDEKAGIYWNLTMLKNLLRFTAVSHLAAWVKVEKQLEDEPGATMPNEQQQEAYASIANIAHEMTDLVTKLVICPTREYIRIDATVAKLGDTLDSLFAALDLLVEKGYAVRRPRVWDPQLHYLATTENTEL